MKRTRVAAAFLLIVSTLHSPAARAATDASGYESIDADKAALSAAAVRKAAAGHSGAEAASSYKAALWRTLFGDAPDIDASAAIGAFVQASGSELASLAQSCREGDQASHFESGALDFWFCVALEKERRDHAQGRATPPEAAALLKLTRAAVVYARYGPAACLRTLEKDVSDPAADRAHTALRKVLGGARDPWQGERGKELLLGFGGAGRKLFEGIEKQGCASGSPCLCAWSKDRVWSWVNEKFHSPQGCVTWREDCSCTNLDPNCGKLATGVGECKSLPGGPGTGGATDANRAAGSLEEARLRQAFARDCGGVAGASLAAYREGDAAAWSDFVNRLTRDVRACDPGPGASVVSMGTPEQNPQACLNACIRGLKSGVHEDLAGTLKGTLSAAHWVATHFMLGPAGLPIPTPEAALQLGHTAYDVIRALRDNPQGLVWLTHCLDPGYLGNAADLDRARKLFGSEGPGTLPPSQQLCALTLLDAAKAQVDSGSQAIAGYFKNRLTAYRCLAPEAREELACHADGMIGAEIGTFVAGDGIGDAVELFRGGAKAEAVVARAFERNPAELTKAIEHVEAPPAGVGGTLGSPGAPPASQAVEESISALQKSGLDRITRSVSHETGTYLYEAPATSFASPIAGRPPVQAPAMSYLTQLKDSEVIAQNTYLTDEPLERIGAGGNHVVYGSPHNPDRALRVIDSDRMWSMTQRSLREKIPLGGPEGADAQAELDRLTASIEPGMTHPPEMDRIAVALMQREKALGPVLREEVVPELNKAMGNVRVSMAWGLENPLRRGVTEVERVRFGPVEPGNPRSPLWVDAADYISNLPAGSSQRLRMEQLSRQWTDALRPYNQRLAGANEAFGLNLSKNGHPIALDIGNPMDNMANTALLLDADGNPLEVKILDF